MKRRQYYKSLDMVELDGVVGELGGIDTHSLIAESFKTGLCPICHGRLNKYRHIPEFTKDKYRPSKPWIIMYPTLYLCNLCNWWHSNKEGRVNGNGKKTYDPNMYYPVLGEVDISSNSIMLDELKINLLKNWKDRKLISAGKAESLVQSILKEHLSCDIYTSTANVNKSDGGIDLHVCSKNGQIIKAIQVKRRISKDAEPVSEVRNFVGAMEVEGIKKGIFVTTAERFTKPAQKIPEKLKKVNSRLELELIDGQRLFELLKCSIRPETLIIPPGINDKSVWVSQSGKKFTTLSLLYSEQQ